MDSSIEDICGQVIEFDNHIRFAGFATNAGKLISCKYRKDVIPLLTSDETQLSVLDTVLRMRIRKDLEPKLGKVIYSITLYEKVTRATILLNSEEFQPAFGLVKDKASYTCYPGTARIPEGSEPHTINRSYAITAEVDIAATDGGGGVAEGPICAIGGVNSGWSLYIKDRKLVYCYNYLTKRTYIRSTKEVPTGKKLKLRYQFEKTGQEKLGAGGIGRLFINNEKVAEGQIQQTIKARYSLDEGFDVGRDSGSPVSEEYKAGAQFTGGNIEAVIQPLPYLRNYILLSLHEL